MILWVRLFSVSRVDEVNPEDAGHFEMARSERVRMRVQVAKLKV